MVEVKVMSEIYAHMATGTFAPKSLLEYTAWVYDTMWDIMNQTATYDTYSLESDGSQKITYAADLTVRGLIYSHCLVPVIPQSPSEATIDIRFDTIPNNGKFGVCWGLGSRSSNQLRAKGCATFDASLHKFTVNSGSSYLADKLSCAGYTVTNQEWQGNSLSGNYDVSKRVNIGMQIVLSHGSVYGARFKFSLNGRAFESTNLIKGTDFDMSLGIHPFYTIPYASGGWTKLFGVEMVQS